MKRKRIIIVIAIAIIVVLGIGIFFSIKSANSGITGNEWLLEQENYLTDVQDFCSNMDEVFSLYIMGTMSKADFVNEITIMKTEYAVIQSDYEKVIKNNPVKAGSYSYVSKRGIDGITNARKYIADVLNVAIGEDGVALSIDEEAYQYLAFKQNLSDALADYQTACLWLKAE